MTTTDAKSIPTASSTFDALLRAVAHTPMAEPFTGTDRYRAVRCLGEGGFGIVYEVEDLQQGRRVALKMLKPRATGFAATIRRLKSEFRSVADIVHPNVVGLEELFCDGGRWFFVMELVRGTNLLQYVRAGALPRANSTERDSAELVSLSRLRASLRQLVAGVAAMHERGIVHRDIKPSNVLVEEDGRVVILDFGLAQAFANEPSMADADASQLGAGTPHYMAPEQALAMPAGPAADVYAIGVILYEALTGRPPFDGDAIRVLCDKAADDPLPASARATVPPDLDALCQQMLARVPSARPSLEEVAARLGSSGRAATAAARSEPAAVLGRRDQLDALHAAASPDHSGPHVVFVYGPAGIGKSAVLGAFARQLRDGGRATVLAGTCHERESVPFKGVDGIVDALVEYLRRLPRNEAAALMPRDIHLAVRVFPMLGAVAAVRDVPARDYTCADARRVRHDAFVALKELVARIADKTQLVMVVDDLQWSDADSAQLLSWLLAAPDPPRALLVVGHRSEDHHGPAGPVAAAREAFALSSVPTSDVEIPPLPPAAAAALALRVLDGVADRERVADKLVARGEGHPLFIHELAREYARFGASSDETPDLVEVLWRRIARCSSPARRLLDAIALAGRPLAPELCFEAANLGEAGAGALRVLRSEQLVRTTDSGALGVFHDRIRDTIRLRADGPRQEACHLSLARALERSADPDSEVLAWHYDAADRRVEAGRHAVRAAERAMTTMAFDRAASLYQMAIERLPPKQVAGGELHAKRARALLLAGSTAEASQAYLDAAERADAVTDEDRAADLRRRGYEHAVVAGEFEVGSEGLMRMLASVGVRTPTSRRGQMVRLAYELLRFRVRGLRFRTRTDDEIDVSERRCMDVLASASRAFDYTAPHLSQICALNLARRALASGQPRRIARGLLAAAPLLVAQRRGDSAIFERVVERAEEIGRSLDDAAILADVAVCRGLAMICFGDWPRARQQLAQAIEMAARGPTDKASTTRYARALALYCAMCMGDHRVAADDASDLLLDAEQRQDPIGATFARLAVFVDHQLNADDLPAAERLLDLSRQETRCTVQLLRAEATHRVSLYSADPQRAVEAWEDVWPRLQRDGWFFVPFVRVRAGFGRAMALIARGSPQDAAAARRYARLSRSVRSPYGFAHEAAVEACRRANDADRSKVAQRFAATADRFADLAMRPLELGCRIRAAELAGRSDAAADASRDLAALGITDVGRWLGAWLPLPGQAALPAAPP